MRIWQKLKIRKWKAKEGDNNEELKWEDGNNEELNDEDDDEELEDDDEEEKDIKVRWGGKDDEKQAEEANVAARLRACVPAPIAK